MRKLYLLFTFLLFSIFYIVKVDIAFSQTCSGSYTSTGLYRCAIGRDGRYYCATDGTETMPCRYSSFWGACAAVVYVPEDCVVSPDGQSCVVYNRYDRDDLSSCRTTYPGSQTPTPTPPPGGGGGGGGTYGACGSCNTCGFDSRQCRLDPTGACVWDPSGCPIEGGATCPWTDNRPFCVGEGESASFCRSQPGADPRYCQCCSGLQENPSGTCVCPASCSISVRLENYNLRVGETTKAEAYLTIQRGNLQSPGVTFTQRNPTPPNTQVLTFARYPSPTPNAFSSNYSDSSANRQGAYEASVRGEASGSALVRASATVRSDGINYTCRADTQSRVNVTVANCSCTPNFSVSLMSGETRRGVNIATLSNYSNPVTVTTLDNTKLVLLEGEQERDSIQTQTTSGTVIVDMRAKETDQRVLASLNIQSDSSGGGNPCDCNYTVAINPNNYFQAIDADVVSAQDIKSYLPENVYLLLKKQDTPDDTPGIAFYGRNLTLGAGEVSVNNWKANTNITSNYSNYLYPYFAKKTPSEVRTRWEEEGKVLTSTSIPITRSLQEIINQEEYIQKGGYYWTKVEGNIEINQSSNFSSKLILLVDGNLTIKGNITLSDDGFLMIIASGNVSVDPDVTEVNGIIVTNQTFSSGTKGRRLDNQLIFKGSILANKISLQRSLPPTSPSQPAEIFEYKPNYVLSLPRYYWIKKHKWRETNP